MIQGSDMSFFNFMVQFRIHEHSYAPETKPCPGGDSKKKKQKRNKTLKVTTENSQESTPSGVTFVSLSA